MQMFSTLKENHFLHCLTPSCSANQEEKGGETECLDSFPLLFQEAVWENNCSGSAFQNSISSPSHQQRASPQPKILLHPRTLQSSSCWSSWPFLETVMCAIQSTAPSTSPWSEQHMPKCYKPLCTQSEGIHAAPRHFVNKQTGCITDKKYKSIGGLGI